MSVAEAAHRPANTGRAITLWLAFILIIGAGVGLAWLGAGALRPTVTASGLQFRVIKAGSGPRITRPDAALLDYVLTADDGSVFDSSETHGGAQPFSMDRVYPGFAEAMTRMQQGGIYRFSLPEKIAWGEGQTPQGWPTGSALNFQVQVRKIVPGGAAILEQQIRQQQLQQRMQQELQGSPPQQ
jgi:hypothetical protein